jgi:hypothetical protein
LELIKDYDLGIN